MYKIATDLAQRRARQLWLADLQGSAYEAMSEEQQRACVVKAKKAVEARLITLPKKSDERAELGQIIHELDAMITAFGSRAKKPADTATAFIWLCRQKLQPFQFKMLMSEAARMVENGWVQP